MRSRTKIGALVVVAAASVLVIAANVATLFTGYDAPFHLFH